MGWSAAFSPLFHRCPAGRSGSIILAIAVTMTNRIRSRFHCIVRRLGSTLRRIREGFARLPREGCVIASLALITGMMPVCQSELNENTSGAAALEPFIRDGDYRAFLAAAKKTPLYKASKNDLIFNLDAGLAEMFIGEYRSGAKRLSSVGDLSEKYYTRSITRQVVSVLTNDLSLPYYGEDYEVTFAGNASALAFAAAGKLEDALVEVRRGEHRLSVMSNAYEGAGESYRDDAFAHYLAGMLYEAAGKADDARISYSLADSVYGSRYFPATPPGLKEALARFAPPPSPPDSLSIGTVSFAGAAETAMPESAQSSQSAAPDSTAPRPVIICAFSGRGPVKDEVVVRANFTNDGIDYVVKLAIPEIRRRTSSIKSARAVVDGRRIALDCAADYGHIAVNAFNDKRMFIYAKTLARVSARYVIIKAAKEKTVEKLQKEYEKQKEKHGEDSSEAAGAWLKMKTASLGLDMLANELLEHADTRSSVMLPERAHCRLVNLPPGERTIKLEYLDSSNHVIASESRDVTISPDDECPTIVFAELR